MIEYIARRLIQSTAVIIIVSILIFFGMRLLPGDPIYLLLDPDEVARYSAEEIVRLREEAGLNRPLVVQYLEWVSGVLRGDLGKSMLYGTSVGKDIARRMPVTAHLGIMGFLMGVFIGIPAGIISAIRRGTWLDTIVTVFANLGITVPIFWLGFMLVYLFALKLGWLPSMGYTSPFDDFWLSTRKIILPLICLSVPAIAGNTRLTRSSVLEVLGQDFIRTAWAKGLKERAVIVKHVLKASLIPVVTMAGMGIGGLLGGSVLIERVFNIPGMGRLMVDSVFTRDYAYVQSISLIITSCIVLANLIVDISYGWLDPRIRR